MRNRELFDALDRLIPRSLSCDWDNDGLMCAAGLDREAKRVLLTLDITEAAAAYAGTGGFDAVISHHPLIFKPLKALTSEKIMGLVRADITAMAFHTRLDAADGGVNDALAERIGLEGTEKFGELLRVGEYAVPVPFDDFLALVKNALGCPFVTAARRHDAVRRVAVVGGDGKDYYGDAAACSADVYLTGAMSYNTMADTFDADGPSVVEAGHFHTEIPVLYKLAEILQKLDAGTYTEIFMSDPLKYY